jgi:spoIIIJ-associated protein
MEKIKTTIEKIIELIGFKVENIAIKKDSTSKDREVMEVNIEISPRDADVFIRDKAEGLSALQHLVRSLLIKTNPGQFVVLDINNYKETRKNELNEIAIDAAKKVRRTKEPLTLEPMSAYERRIIHLKLAELPDIVTESIGEEPERKLVVRLYP